ncbi:unnamed protein product [Heterobilharzia americana]|nr:unnamed protein product [Heterobilharzia americana]
MEKNNRYFSEQKVEYANKLEKCLEYQAHGSCTYKDTDLNKEHYVKNSFHSNNINNWSTIDAPNSSSVGIIEKPLQSTHSHSLVLNLTSEVKNNPQNSNKKDKPSIENDLLHVNNTDLKFNLSHGRHDCCCHQFGFPQSTSHGSINQDCIEHTDKSSKYPHSLLIYHKPRITSKTLASGNCLNFLNELHHVNHQTQVKHSNERFNREHDGDVFGPRVWQNWKSWVD